MVLMEPKWNVKVGVYKYSYAETVVLMEPKWNVKDRKRNSKGCQSIRINGTKVECKVQSG